MRARSRIVAIVAIGWLPIGALAQSSIASSSSSSLPAYSRLQSTIQLIEPGLRQDGVDTEYDQLQILREEDGELFADLTPEASSASSHAASSSASSQFVSFEENGAVVALKDVPRQAWFAPYVRAMIEKKVLSGYRDAAGKPLGEFRPANPVTVEELAAMVTRAAQIDSSTCGTPKNATATAMWSKPFIACGESHGWSLFAESSVDVRRPATRAEVVQTVLQAFQVDTSKVVLSGTGSLRDINATMSFGVTVEKAIKDGIVSGYADAAGNPTGLFGPNLNINRAEVAKVLSLAVQVYGR